MDAAAARPASLTRASLLADLTRLGPQFALEVHPAGSVANGQWQPFGELLGALDDRVASVRAALAGAVGRSPADVELRVAVSMTQLGLTGRLLCPALGVAVLAGGLLDLDPAWLCWRPGPGGAVSLSVRAQAVPVADRPRDGTPHAPLTDQLAATVLGGPVRLLVEASRRYGVSSRVLWGNVASVVHGVPALIGAGRPDLLAVAEALAADLLDRPPLRGTAQAGPGTGFRRRSCCLVYRLARSESDQAGSNEAEPNRAAAVCGDCVLDRR